MNDKGKKVQICFDSLYSLDRESSLYEVSQISFMVWTDSGLEELINSIEGVDTVLPNYQGMKSCYAVFFDKRYDMDFIKAEIEAAVILKLGEI